MKNNQVYTCPMHPVVKSGNSGRCPKCGMELVQDNGQFLLNVKQPKKHSTSKKSEFAAKNEKVIGLVEKLKEVFTHHKPLCITLTVFLLSLAWFLWVIWYKVIPNEAQQVHYHAGFIVIKNNQQENFSDQKYMKTEACIESGIDHRESEEEEQIEKAHLHGNVGDVVHVENDEGKWKDLFNNIKYDINYSETDAYLNGEKITNFQNRSVQSYDSLVVFVGAGNDVSKFLPLAVTKEHIQEAESISEDCGGH